MRCFIVYGRDRCGGWTDMVRPFHDSRSLPVCEPCARRLLQTGYRLGDPGFPSGEQKDLVEVMEVLYS